MINHYIKNITIENFKCFQNLQVEGIERINLIGGKNDIGKTAFLEAVELLVSSSTAKDLAVNAHKILIRRQTNNVKISIKHIILNLIKRREKILKIIANNKTCKIYLNQFSFFDIETYLNRESHENDIVTDNTLSFIINRDKTTISIDKFLKYKISFPDIKILKNIKFINVAKEYDIVNLYSSLIDLERKEFLNTCLTKFDENIVSLNAVQTKDGLILKLKLKNKKNLILLSSLGEGINKYIAILCAIWASKDGYLFVDEIESGIHYTNYKILWQAIFQASIDANCQLFVTSNSKECINAFNTVQFEQKGGIYFELCKDVKMDIIMATKMDKNLLKYVLTK